MEAQPSDWRTQKKAATRSTIRRHALRLFLKHGYDGVTVEQIAGAAGVSHMTFFRYFPTKEDVVLGDPHNPRVVTLIKESPADLPPAERIRRALLTDLSELYEVNREAMLTQNRIIAVTPALRARLWEDQVRIRQLFLEALGLEGAGTELLPRLRAQVVVAACLGAVITATLIWAENGGCPELPELLDQAFDALAVDLTRPGVRETGG